VIRIVSPKYPPEAESAGVKGKVVIKLRIDEEGKIESARVIKGHRLLRRAALEAAKGWKFLPVTFKEKRIKYAGTITVYFSEDTK
jgi:TonB family protein